MVKLSGNLIKNPRSRIHVGRWNTGLLECELASSVSSWRERPEDICKWSIQQFLRCLCPWFCNLQLSLLNKTLLRCVLASWVTACAAFCLCCTEVIVVLGFMYVMNYAEGKRFWISLGDSCNSDLKMSQHSHKHSFSDLLIQHC